jgi:hypothetical protein
MKACGKGLGTSSQGRSRASTTSGPFLVNGSNIQGQLNGVPGNSTFSCALLDPALDPAHVRDPGNQVYVLRQVKTALANSHSERRVYTVTGTSP